MKIISIRFIIATLIMTVSVVRAATNDLSAVLQRGLFEEEANHNLEAAIQAYQSVISQYDQDRNLAATAVFRLGESYRKQGKTNEANAQYARVSREFADQSELVALSGAYLAASGQSEGSEKSGAAPSTSAEAEEVKRIQAMIKDSPDLINAMGPANESTGRPLHEAAAKGQLVVAQFLLANGADIEAKHLRLENRTALHMAATAGHKAMVELLLNKGANVNSVDSGGFTPLHLAAGHGFRNIVEVLLAHGADVNAKTTAGCTPLHLAVGDGFRSVVELLLERKADVNVVSKSVPRFSTGGWFSGAALHVAAQSGDPSMTELLLEHNANINALDPTGEMALHIAASKGLVRVATVLLAHGASIDPKIPPGNGDVSGQTPLTFAVGNNLKEMVALLLERKADPNTKFYAYLETGQDQQRRPSSGITSLIFATRKGHAEIVDALLAGKADPNLKSDDERIPIFEAVECAAPARRQRLTQLLLEYGADANTTNREQVTPLMRAVGLLEKEVVQLLLAHKADVNAKDMRGITPLHFAASVARSGANMNPIAELLIAAGGDVNARNHQGQTPLQWTDSGVHSAELAALLRQHGALDDVPRPEVIQFRFPSNNYATAPLSKGTNGWNHFTVLELIGLVYDFLETSAQGQSRESQFREGLYLPSRPAFPDFSRVQIRRPAADLKSWQERTIDLTPVIESGNCANDEPLEWGDAVQIGEADHSLNAQWQGFSTNELASLKKCLSRQVTVIVKGEPKRITLAPDITLPGDTQYPGANVNFVPGRPVIKTHTAFWIKPALRESNLLLSNCDLSHVKVTRHDPRTGRKLEWIVDCSNPNYAPDLWLVDGDVIDVPDKT